MRGLVANAWVTNQGPARADRACMQECARTVVTDERTHALCPPKRIRNTGINSVKKQILCAAALKFPPKQAQAHNGEDDDGEREKQNDVYDRAKRAHQRINDHSH